jgi:hypothetical protein
MGWKTDLPQPVVGSGMALDTCWCFAFPAILHAIFPGNHDVKQNQAERVLPDEGHNRVSTVEAGDSVSGPDKIVLQGSRYFAAFDSRRYVQCLAKNTAVLKIDPPSRYVFFTHVYESLNHKNLQKAASIMLQELLSRQALCSYLNSSYLMSIFDAAVLIMICNMRHTICIYGQRSIRYCTISVNGFKAPNTLYVICQFQFSHS